MIMNMIMILTWVWRSFYWIIHFSRGQWVVQSPVYWFLVLIILDSVILVAITLSYICVSELSWCWATGMLGCVVLLLCLGCLCFGFMHAPIPPCLWKYFWLQCCDVNFELTSPLMYMSLFIHNFIFIFCR